MPTIRQLIQTSPAKANELFTKLVETSGNAVKTRERLFSELKEELELQMKLEEQHLARSKALCRGATCRHNRVTSREFQETYFLLAQAGRMVDATCR